MSAEASASGSGWLVACDLDQTLIYSRSAFRLPAGAAPPDVVTVEYLNGEPLSYVTRPAAAALQALAQEATLVPVTTRTLEQYRRVQLGTTGRYAIAANGGHLIIDGVPDPGWAQAVKARLAAAGCSLERVRRIADGLADAGSWVRTIRDADGFFVYLVALRREAIPDLSGLAARLAGDGWTLSIQGRKVYLVPAGLTKEAALAELLTRTGSTRLAAAGDSLLDRGMLALADVAVRPAHGELHDQGFWLPEMRVSASAGLAGGAQIVELLGEIVRATKSAPAAPVGTKNSPSSGRSFPARAG